MGLDVVGICRASVRSATALVTAFSGNRLGDFLWASNSSVVSDTCSDVVLRM